MCVRSSLVLPAVENAAVFTSLIPYNRSWLRGDLLAGLTVWAVLVPEALAHASIAGVFPRMPAAVDALRKPTG